MAVSYIVTAPAVAVTVPLGPHTSQVRFVEAGGSLPAGVETSIVEHLLSQGMIEAIDDVEAEADPKPEEPPKLPHKGRAPRGKAAAPGQSEGLNGLTVDELLAEAKARGIEVPEGVSDPADLIALIEQ